MSEITDLLWVKAREFEKAASDKASEWRMIKSAAVNSLEEKGITDATDLLDQLAEKAYPNLEADLEKAAELADLGKIFEKTAHYIGELEAKLEGKEEEISGLQKAAENAVKAPAVEALSGTGAFTNEDLDTLNSLDEGTLQKVAGLADNSPWNIGGPSERPGGGEDALTKFLLS